MIRVPCRKLYVPMLVKSTSSLGSLCDRATNFVRNLSERRAHGCRIFAVRRRIIIYSFKIRRCVSPCTHYVCKLYTRSQDNEIHDERDCNEILPFVERARTRVGHQHHGRLTTTINRRLIFS